MVTDLYPKNKLLVINDGGKKLVRSREFTHKTRLNSCLATINDKRILLSQILEEASIATKLKSNLSIIKMDQGKHPRAPLLNHPPIFLSTSSGFISDLSSSVSGRKGHYPFVAAQL